MPTTLLKIDAKNRALRTFLVGLATDVLGAVVLLLTPLITSANSWSDLDWKLMGFLLAKTAVSTAFSYLLRTVLDPSKFPTPLPPADPGEPDAAPGNEAGAIGVLEVLVIVLIVVVVLVLLGFVR